MKAVVLAGGFATRLWPITKHRPKMFLPIGDQTVVDRILAGLEGDDRIEEVFLSTNAQFAEDFGNHLATASYEKPILSVEETTAEAEKLGAIGALAQLIEREGIDEDLLVIAGDNLLSFDLGDFLDFFAARDATSLAAYDVGSLDRAQEYGVVALDCDRVVDFQEKPEVPPSTLVSIACYAFPVHALSSLDAYLDERANSDEPGSFIAWLQADRPVYAFRFEDAWFDIGTPESYLEAVKWYLGGERLIADDAVVDESHIGENVHVMSGAEIRDSHVVDSVIFGDSRIENCEIRECIIDEQTEIEGIDLNGALIGAHSQITHDH